jgi:hypothetical protein
VTDEHDGPGEGRHARLELKMGDDVHVVLEGDPAFVMEAYQRVQENVAKALVDKSTAPEPTASSEGEAEGEDLHAKLARDGDMLWVYRCEDEMRTVYCTRRERFRRLPLVRAYGLGGVDRVYVEDERILRALRRGARTLWRELEPAGLKRIQEAAAIADERRRKADPAHDFDGRETTGAKPHLPAPGPGDSSGALPNQRAPNDPDAG